MLACMLIKIKNYGRILLLLLFHVKQKWKICPKKILSIFLIMIAGILLPFIASNLYGLSIDYFTIISTSISMGICGLIILVISSNIPISRVLYELRYFKRMLNFMLECYQNLIHEYKTFLKTHTIYNRSNKKSKDLTVISIIFFKIFTLYFDTMNKKNKNSEPYLIDTQEMENLYCSKNFNNFYSTLFFDPSCNISNTSYDAILLQILEEVMTTLYQKSWFIEYYDEYTVFQLIKYMLTHWYGNIVQYKLRSKMLEEGLY